MFTRGLFVTPDIQEQHNLLTTVAKLIDEGKIKATGTSNAGTICAANLIKVHRQLEEGHVIGKIVLSGW